MQLPHTHAHTQAPTLTSSPENSSARVSTSSALRVLPPTRRMGLHAAASTACSAAAARASPSCACCCSLLKQALSSTSSMQPSSPAITLTGRCCVGLTNAASPKLSPLLSQPSCVDSAAGRQPCSRGADLFACNLGAECAARQGCACTKLCSNSLLVPAKCLAWSASARAA